MEDPAGQIIADVVRPLLLGSPEECRNVVSTYFTPSCSVHHPLFKVEGSLDSKDTASRVFAARSEAFSSRNLNSQSVALDETNIKICCDVTRTISLRLIPITAVSIRSMIAVQLIAGGDGKYYISRWEELLQSDDLANLMFLPGIRFVVNTLRRLASTATSLSSFIPFIGATASRTGDTGSTQSRSGSSSSWWSKT